MSQLSLLETAAAERVTALQRVDQAADPEWKDIAYDAVVKTARELPEMAADRPEQLAESAGDDS